MLEVQKYLCNGGTLESLERDYSIKARICDQLGVVCLNYSQILSPMNEWIPRECRALILELGTWQIVSRSFPKFFNYGETEAATIDWATARVEEKLDGSLICFYHWRDEWQIATRGVADASGQVGSGTGTFRDLVLQAISDMGHSFREFTNLLSSDVFYSFELTAPDNRVIVPYWDRQLRLIGAWRKSTMTELDPTECGIARARVVSTAKKFPLNVISCAELAELVSTLQPHEGEGFVVVDAQWNRVKIKSPLYVAASSLVGALSTVKQRLELLRSDKYDDVSHLLPDHVKSEVDTLSRRLRTMSETISKAYDVIAAIESQKDFAAAALMHPYSAVLFNLRKGDDIETCFNRLTIDSFVRIYEAIYPEAA